MKNVSLIFNIVLSAAVITLFVLFFTSPKSNSDNNSVTENSEVGITAAAGDIVFIQMDSLIQNYDMFHDLSSEFNAKAQTVQDDLNKRGRAFENDVKNFQEKIQKGLLTTSQATAQQQDLERRQEELRNLAQQREYELSEENSVMMNRVMDAVQTYMAKYNESKKYALILTTTSANMSIIIGQNSVNITQDVLAGLNSEYIATKNRKK